MLSYLFYIVSVLSKNVFFQYDNNKKWYLGFKKQEGLLLTDKFEEAIDFEDLNKQTNRAKHTEPLKIKNIEIAYFLQRIFDDGRDHSPPEFFFEYDNNNLSSPLSGRIITEYNDNDILYLNCGKYDSICKFTENSAENSYFTYESTNNYDVFRAGLSHRGRNSFNSARGSSSSSRSSSISSSRSSSYSHSKASSYSGSKSSYSFI